MLGHYNLNHLEDYIIIYGGISSLGIFNKGMGKPILHYKNILI